MLVPPIALGVIESRRRRPVPSRPVVADIDPDVALDRLPLDQDRHGNVVAVQPLGQQARGARSAHGVAAGPPHRRRPGRPASTRSNQCLHGGSVRAPDRRGSNPHVAAGSIQWVFIGCRLTPPTAGRDPPLRSITAKACFPAPQTQLSCRSLRNAGCPAGANSRALR